MAFKQVIINNFEDYLTEIKDFALLNGWSLLDFTNDINTNFNNRLVLSNINNSVCIGYRLKYEYKSDFYTNYKDLDNCYININVFKNYDANLDFTSQESAYPGGGNISNFSFRDDTPAVLYIHINDNRIVTCVSQSHIYSNCMIGKYSGYASEIQQEDQFFICTQNSIRNDINSLSNGDIYNYIYCNFDDSWKYENVYPNKNFFNNIVKNFDNSTYSLHSVVLYENKNDGYAKGELDEIYLISNCGISPGAEFSYNNINYLVLPLFTDNSMLYCIPKE